MSFEKPGQRSIDPEGALYNFENVDHAMVKKFRPKFIAKGGEHIVYEIPEHPGIVVKANIQSIRLLLDENMESKRRPDDLTRGMREYARKFLHGDARKYQKIKAYFGAEHVLNQKKFLLKIPITKTILAAIYKNEGTPPETGEVWSEVMIQKRADLEGPDHLSLDTGGYAEHRELPPETYEKATRHLLYGDEQSEISAKDALMGLLGDGREHLQELLARAEGDEGLAATLKDLVEKMIFYFEETGTIFDVVGDNNIAIMKENGRWTYKFVDAISAGEGDMPDIRRTITTLALGNEIGRYERIDLLNALNFIRTANGLAEILGSEKRIRIIPDEVYDSHIDFQDILKRED